MLSSLPSLTSFPWTGRDRWGTWEGRHFVMKVLQRTSHNRFYNLLERHQRSWACAGWGCESGPLLLSKMLAAHTATAALNAVSGVPAPRSCAIPMPQIKSRHWGDLNMGSLRALHLLRGTQMHGAGSFLSGSFVPYVVELQS